MLTRKELSDWLNSDEPEADLFISNGNLVNVHTKEVHSADIAIKGDRIAMVSDEANVLVGESTKVIDAEDKFITPGLIDTHFHVAGTYLTMTKLAEALLNRGTTAIATDFYEYGAVSGVEAIKFALKESKETPLKILFNVPLLAYYQNNPFGNTDKVQPKELSKMISWPDTVAINEVQSIMLDDPEVKKLVEKSFNHGKAIQGHAPLPSEKELAALQALGPSSDHESIKSEEVLEKIRRGVKIMIREGSAATNLNNVIEVLTENKVASRHFMFCTDEEDALDLSSLGHMDFKVKKAISRGLDPVTAVQIATINAAEFFKVDDELGSIA
ncbi:hypothetical protein AKJ37_06035, partial [candidate division MSBL1 archaeon SCGC-AAA259I09]